MLIKEIINRSFPDIRNRVLELEHRILERDGYECRECHSQVFESHLNVVCISDAEAGEDRDYITLCDHCLSKKKRP